MNKIFILLLACIFITKIGTSQDVQLTIKEEKAIDALKFTLFTGNKNTVSYLDHHTYNYKRDDEGNLFIYPDIYVNSYDPMAGDNNPYYKISNKDGIPSIIEIFEKCDIRRSFIRLDKWNGDEIGKTASRGLEDGQLNYGEDGKISNLDLGRSYKRSGKDKIFKNSILKVGYDEKNRLSSLEKEILVYAKSKDANNLKKDYTYTEYILKVNYGDELTTMNIDFFKPDGKKILPKSNVLYTLKKNGKSISIEKTNKVHGHKGETVYKSIIHNDYDQKMRIIKRQEEDQHKTLVNEYVYDDYDNPIKEIFAKTYMEKNEETIIERTYDDNQFPKTEKKIIKVNGKLSETIETQFTYAPKDKGSRLNSCESQVERSSKYYNAEGELYQEINKNKIKQKKDGKWGEWEYRM